MIMPANYSVIAENELSYVDGGVTPITSLAILDKNIVEWIGNAYANSVMNAFIGNFFKADGEAKILGDVVLPGIKGLFTTDVANQPTTAGKILRGVTNTIGVLAGIYVLGAYDDAVKVHEIGNLAL